MPQDTVDQILEQWRLERPELDASGLAIVLRVMRLAGHFEERLKAALEPTGLLPFEYDVLSALRRSSAGGGLSPGQLCDASQLSSGAMTHRLRRLEEDGWIKRSQDQVDRRGRTVTLTAKGRQKIDLAVEARMREAAHSVEVLDERAQAQLSKLLRQLTHSLPRPE